MPQARNRHRWLAAAFILPLAVAALLLYPYAPSTASSLLFDGYLVLPWTGPLAALDYLALAPGHLYVTSLSGAGVYDVALYGTRAPRRLPLPGAAHGVVLLSGGARGLLTRGDAGTVTVFDPRNMAPMTSVPVGVGPDALFHDPATGQVYVANAGDHSATLIDASSLTVTATLALPGQPEYAALDGGAGLLYQNLADRDAIAIVDLRRRIVTAQWLLNGCREPSGSAIDPVRRRLFIVCSGSAALHILDLDTRRLIATLPLGRLSDSVAFDPAWHRLYVASGAGQLTVIEQRDGDRYVIVDRLHTGIGAHTLAIDPCTHRLYLAYAGLLYAARVAVFTPRRALM